MQTVDEFIIFYEAIPEDKWTTGIYNYHGQCCALGHLGVRVREDLYEESTENLRSLFCDYLNASIPQLNDGRDYRYTQPTPKQRILAALRDIKEKQAHA